MYKERIQSEVEKQPSQETSNEEKLPSISCSCGVSKGVGSTLQNICNNVPGSYSSRCKCLKSRVPCGDSCRCKGCSNPYGNRQACAGVKSLPRKRRKFDFQHSVKLNSQAYLATKGEPLREGSLTKEEFFVVEELIKAVNDSENELTSTSLLECYNFVQSISCTLDHDPKPLLLRSKTHEQIKKALAAHNHDAAVMTALFKKQVELCYSKTL